MKKFGLAVVSALAGATMMTSAARADCGAVTITEMNWASSQVVTAVAKFLMEQGYGCKVSTVPSATVPAVTSLAETGKPDIVTELWLNGAQALPKLVSEGKVKVLTNVLSDGGVEGWWIPKYVADAHPELKTLDDVLKNPKLVGGRFHNCPDGWGCRIANDNILRAYSAREGGPIEIFDHGSGETLATSIAAAFNDKKPWFGYYWAPTSVLGKYEMVKISLGPVDEKVHACNASKDCKTPGKSDFPPSPVATVATTAFTSKNPDVADMMSKLQFSNKVMNGILAWKEDKKASTDEAAVYFINKHKDIWSTWINDAAKTKLAALLK